MMTFWLLVSAITTGMSVAGSSSSVSFGLSLLSKRVATSSSTTLVFPHHSKMAFVTPVIIKRTSSSTNNNNPLQTMTRIGFGNTPPSHSVVQDPSSWMMTSATTTSTSTSTRMTNAKDRDLDIDMNIDIVSNVSPLQAEDIKVVQETKLPRLVGKSLQQTLNVEDDETLSTRFLLSSLYTHQKPQVVGHRGALYQELENTRPAFWKCAELGADAVELDVFLLRCGTLIVFHGGGDDDSPGDLWDYCNIPGSILDWTYSDLLKSGKIQFNTEFAEFPCPTSKIQMGTIPTLKQVLQDAKQNGLKVKIELKGPGTVEPVLELVEELEMTSQCSYSSFDLEKLTLLRQLRPNSNMYPTGALFDATLPPNYLQLAKECGATEIHLQYDSCTKDRIQEIHDAGFQTMCWLRGPIGMNQDCLEKYWDVGNEDESMYEALLRTGVQQLCVNKPDVLIQLLNKLYSVFEEEENDAVVKASSFQVQVHGNGEEDEIVPMIPLRDQFPPSTIRATAS